MIGRGVKARNVRATLLRLWSYLRVHRGGLFGVLLLVGATTGVGLLTPYLLGLAIDRYISTNNMGGLARIALLMAAVVMVTAFTTRLQTYMMALLAQRTVRNLRRDLFARLQTLSLRFFDGRPHGELMSRLANDVENVSDVLSQALTQLVASVLTSVGVAAAMLVINACLAAVSLLAIPFMALITRTISIRTRRGFRDQQENLGELNSLIEETITGERVVKAYGRENAVVESFEKVNRKLQKASTSAQTFSLVLAPLTNFVNNLGFALVAGFGGWMVLSGLASVGIVAAFINYSRQFARPLNDIANLYNTVQSAVAGAERVFEILDEVPEIADGPNAYPVKCLEGHVEFRDVCFGYKKDQPVLRHVSLEARPGQIIALVGPTGAGKTTIVNLLTRFYDIDSGEILIDGQDLRSLEKDGLRRQLGIVLQETFLFSKPVMENIRYGRLDASDDEVIAAAELANADQFIRRLPEGYRTQLTEEGANVSQGQIVERGTHRELLDSKGFYSRLYKSQFRGQVDAL